MGSQMHEGPGHGGTFFSKENCIRHRVQSSVENWKKKK